MRFFTIRKGEEGVDFQPFFSINDAVRIEVGGRTYASRVEDIEDSGVWVSWPSSFGVPVRMEDGASLVLISSVETGMHAFESRLEERKPGPPCVLKLLPCEALGRVQRRGYARVPDSSPVTFTVLNREARLFGLRVDTTIRNISGGGLRMFVNRDERPMAGDELLLEIRLAGTDPIEARGGAIWVSDRPNEAGMFEMAVRFTKIPEEDRKNIVRYIFAREAKLHRAGLL